MVWKKHLFVGLVALLATGVGGAIGQELETPRAEAREAEADPDAQASEQPPADSEAEPGVSTAPEDATSEAEVSAERERRVVAWDDKVEAVLEKKYPQSLDDLKTIQTQTRRVIEHAMPAVVAVQVGGAFGSAVIVSPDGLVLTAGHVVGRPGQEVRFIFPDGKTARGKTLGMYREIDSGMMKITDPGPWPYVDMAKAGDIEKGEWVVAIGQPGGFDGERTPPVRLGRVLFANDDVISTDCTLVGGDSGGPLFNMHGKVVGVHSRIGRRITDNFHVPISTYHGTWERLVAGELWGAPLDSEEVAKARPLLGVAANPDAPECRLTEVHPPYPAYKAGIRVGDIVTKYNDTVVDTFDSLRRLVYTTKPGERVKIEVLRGGETIEVELRLGLTRKPLPGSADMPEKASTNPDEDE